MRAGESSWAVSLVSTEIALLAAIGFLTLLLLVPTRFIAGVLELVNYKMSSLLYRVGGSILGVRGNLNKELSVMDDYSDYSEEDGSSVGEEEASSAAVASGNRVQDKLRSMVANAESGELANKPTYSVPGLWNAGGNSCFLNATLQAMASVDILRPFLQAIVDLAATFEEKAPVSAALLELFDALNSPCSSQKVYKPVAVAEALSRSSPSRRRMLNADQQDAQEFYLALLAAVTEELDRFQGLANESLTSLGIGSVLDKEFEEEQETIIRNPVLSLHAHRIACTTCGYSEATRHLPSDYLGLNAPNTASCDLEDMLSEFSKLEMLDEYHCRRCSIQATVDRLQHQINTSRSGAGPETTPSKKKRMKETQKHLNRLKTCLEEEDFEKEIAEPKLERVVCPASKQSMFSRPADALIIHISRSTTYSRGGTPLKNTCSVAFPSHIDLTPFCTTSRIRTIVNSAIATPTPLTILESPDSYDVENKGQRHLYRLCSMVVHFGLHNYGHYITYRAHRQGKQTQWFRISDETVSASSLQEVRSANPFLLFYERISPSQKASNNESQSAARTCHRMQSQSA